MAWEFLKRRKLAVFGIIALQLGQVLINLVLPSLIADVIDQGILKDDRGFIWSRGGLMLVASVFQVILTVGAIYLGSKTATQFGRELRADVFRKVQSFSATDQRTFGAPTLITRATNDVNQVMMVILLTFTVMVMAPIMGFGGAIMAIRQDAKLSLLLLVMVPVLALIVGLIMKALSPRYVVQQDRIDRINTLLREQLTGVRVIRAFVRQGTEREKFDVANKGLRQVWLEIGTLWALLFPAAMTIVGLSSVAVVWFGAKRIDGGFMEVGSLTAFISYLMMILGAVMMSGMMAMLLPRGNVSAKRLKEIRDTEPSITAPENPAHLPAGPISFELDNVGLQYPGAEEPVLADLDVTLRPGTTTAVIGSTGSGKSSVIKLFPRLIDATSGEVRAGGVPVTTVDPLELRARIALVPQTAFLFSGTIGSNVAGSARSDAVYDEARVQRALDAAQASEFVGKLDDGMKTQVEAGGKNFSGGQRQRLTIARALYRCIPDDDGRRESDLLIFDDSFSALDFATDSRLRNSLRDYIGDVAVMIIAQRVSTIRQADEILVLDDGRIVGRGTHSELMATCKTYQEIVSSQLSEEEAA